MCTQYDTYTHVPARARQKFLFVDTLADAESPLDSPEPRAYTLRCHNIDLQRAQLELPVSARSASKQTRSHTITNTLANSIKNTLNTHTRTHIHTHKQRVQREITTVKKATTETTTIV